MGLCSLNTTHGQSLADAQAGSDGGGGGGGGSQSCTEMSVVLRELW